MENRFKKFFWQIAGLTSVSALGYGAFDGFANNMPWAPGPAFLILLILVYKARKHSKRHQKYEHDISSCLDGQDH